MWVPRAAVVAFVACFGGAQAAGCETVLVEASGFATVAGYYYLVDTINGRAAYQGPDGAVLRYEKKDADETEGDQLNWGAKSWLLTDSWHILQGGLHRFGLVSSLSLGALSATQSWATREGGVGPVTVTCQECMSTPNWASGIDCAQSGATEEEGCAPEGWTCKAYALSQFCANGAVVAGQENMLGSAHSLPEENCCACGGAWAPTQDDVLAELKKNEASVTTLEDAIMQMTTKFTTAEQALINASNQAATARQGVIDLEADGFKSAMMIKNVSQFHALTKADLDLLKQDLKRSEGRATDLTSVTAESSGESEEVTNATVELEYLNRRIWEAADIKGNASVDVMVSKMKTTQKELDEFDVRVNGRLRELLSKRYRPGANEVRKALRGYRQSLGTEQSPADE